MGNDPPVGRARETPFFASRVSALRFLNGFSPALRSAFLVRGLLTEKTGLASVVEREVDKYRLTWARKRCLKIPKRQIVAIVPLSAINASGLILTVQSLLRGVVLSGRIFTEKAGSASGFHSVQSMHRIFTEKAGSASGLHSVQSMHTLLTEQTRRRGPHRTNTTQGPHRTNTAQGALHRTNTASGRAS